MERENLNNLEREIRKEFFAFRNGIVADKLRKAGDPHPMIMGCLLSDLVGIAQRTRESIGDEVNLAAIATELWSDTNSRECRLAAPMLYPPHLMTRSLALDWCNGIETIEVADNLCHKLLRHVHECVEISSTLIASDNQMEKYTGYRLLMNLLMLGKIQRTESLIATVGSDADNASSPLASLLQDIMEELHNPQE
ncbi:MAG: DNA alkylation repair protein [Muribaculaceae bacterium]|nr:DNA alkylation repair protein [Muribaculaceae bacterium]